MRNRNRTPTAPPRRVVAAKRNRELAAQTRRILRGHYYAKYRVR